MTNNAAFDAAFATMWQRATGEFEVKPACDQMRAILKHSPFLEDTRWELFFDHNIALEMNNLLVGGLMRTTSVFAFVMKPGCALCATDVEGKLKEVAQLRVLANDA